MAIVARYGATAPTISRIRRPRRGGAAVSHGLLLSYASTQASHVSSQVTPSIQFGIDRVHECSRTFVVTAGLGWRLRLRCRFTLRTQSTHENVRLLAEQ